MKDTRTTLETTEQYNELVNNEAKAMELNYIMSDPSKTAKRLSNITKTRGQLERQAKAKIDKVYRVKNSRTGHINSAPAKVQELHAEIKSMIEGITWEVDGKTIVMGLLTKVQK